MRELGWVEGRTIAIEYRWSEGRPGHVDAAQRTFDGVDVIHFQLGVLLRNADNSNAFDVFPCTSEQGIFGDGTG